MSGSLSIYKIDHIDIKKSFNIAIQPQIYQMIIRSHFTTIRELQQVFPKYKSENSPSVHAVFASLMIPSTETASL